MAEALAAASAAPGRLEKQARPQNVDDKLTAETAAPSLTYDELTMVQGAAGMPILDPVQRRAGARLKALAAMLGANPSARGQGALMGFFVLVGIVLWAEPVIREFLGHLNSQDYPLWFTVGQRVLRDGPIYDTVGGATLDASFTAVKRYTGHVLSSLGW